MSDWNALMVQNDCGEEWFDPLDDLIEQQTASATPVYWDMTPIDEFIALLPEGHGLSGEQIRTMRDLVDAQADVILDFYIQDKVDGKI